MRVATELDNLLKVSKLKSIKPDTKGHSFASLGFAYYETKFSIDGKLFSGILNIALSEDGKMLYELNNIKIEDTLFNGTKSASVKEVSSNNGILHTEENVNTKTKKNITKYSIAETDSKGRKLTKEQQEFFKESKVRDEQGRLIAVYHGTDADFNVFDRTKFRSYSMTSYDLPAFYFTPDKRQAKDYGSRVIEAYINITNPLIAEDQLPTLKEGESPNESYNRLVEEGYDGIIIPAEELSDTEYIAFHPNQIKSVENINPTQNEDIRYSLDGINPIFFSKFIDFNYIHIYQQFSLIF
ncbi:MAG TPA: hypothetical protein GX745_02155 [Clostridiales bacterium]|nr:hypothetical protein [Clostridiales bacterium]